MMKESTFQGGDSSHLLKQLEDILQCDTLIDEVGFIHPTQFVELNQDTSNSSDVNLEDNNSMFWNRDHKLAISTQALFPLYTAARRAFMTATAQYKMLLKLPRKEDNSMNETSSDISSFSKDFLECEIMKHTKALLILSCDFTTAWNSRKLVVSKKQNFSQFLEELLLSALVLSYSPKSEHAWSHRRWVIKTISGRHPNLQEILEKESDLVEKIAEKSKMNYRAWNHRCWLVSYMKSRQVLDELNKSKKWAELHVADNCCFNYRQQLLIRMLEQGFLKHGQDVRLNSLLDLYHIWKEELDWDEMLIKRYIGREALWIHRRFLSQYWVNHFALVQGPPIPYQDDIHIYHAPSTFMDDELQLLHTCLTLPNNDFEDGHTQAVLAVAYILWVSKQVPQPELIKVQEKLRELGDLKTLLNKLCPERTLLWNGLIG